MIIQMLIVIGLFFGLKDVKVDEVQVPPIRLKPIHTQPDGELKYYYDEVVALSGGKLSNPEMTMGLAESHEMNLNKKASTEIIGLCYMNLNEVSINRRFFESNGMRRNLLLIAHEMYHCTCWKSHTDKKLKDGCPSYMNAMIPSKKCIDKNYYEYIEEISKGCEL